MRRRPLYYVFTYMMPCIGCTAFVFLGFILPGECGEKVFLDIKVLLSLILFFFTVGEVMPPTATNVPLIGYSIKIKIKIKIEIEIEIEIKIKIPSSF
jgi:Neurotransmitter-gated ion-channel transmembrane region